MSSKSQYSIDCYEEHGDVGIFLHFHSMVNTNKKQTREQTCKLAILMLKRTKRELQLSKIKV
jgi:hypothetical protein